MKKIKNLISRINWKLIISDLFLACFMELLVINSFIIGNLPEFKEYEKMYWVMFGRFSFAFIILVIIARLMISVGQGYNPYIKPAYIFLSKEMQNIARNTLEQGDRIKATCFDDAEYEGTIYKIALGLNNENPTQASIILTEDKSENMTYGQVHIFCEDLKSIEKMN